MKSSFVILLLALGLCYGQKKGTQTQELHLDMPISNCESGSCSTQATKITIDSNWRWTHDISSATNCYTGNEWSSQFCPDSDTCTANCAIDGVDQNTWTGTYGITAGGGSVTLKFVTHGPYSTNIGSRLYLLESDSAYRMFHLKNREFSIDVDSSNLPCGLNGAMYFVEMDQDGGLSEYPTNEAGAAYGTGYCDAQCPHDMKFIAGKANCDEWVPSADDPNSGTGKYGICCPEMDIWEANSQAQSFTSHPCNVDGYTPCTGTDCGDNGADRYSGVCDKDGCDFAAYRNGVHDFYGPGMTVDSSKKVTLVTQFITSDGTDNGDLVEVRRIFIQDGQTIQNTAVNFPGVTAYDSITEEYCHEIKSFFGDFDDHSAKGGLKAMGDSLGRGHVLVMSLWDDHYAHMLWLDSSYPTTGDLNAPGVLRGPCPTTGGVPSELENQYADASVTFSNIKIGPIQTY
ncbi:Glycosyl Hydrolase 7 [Hyalella azteca]|uniref:cellulose 1,4-beta-cellobiosidase (non-reducing end) n=1 Tax=Hyalella azteca TaxID=294128 RepID=A0A6A0H7L8_HYAAZ|nr:exoglucanase GH7B [Hyalella azteca]KAA0201489.1 Glycosyl Hydrolase 7 [Hyalella azteca]